MMLRTKYECEDGLATHRELSVALVLRNGECIPVDGTEVLTIDLSDCP